MKSQSNDTMSPSMVGNRKTEDFMGHRSGDLAFKNLCRAPTLAKPTLTLFLVSTLGYLGILFNAINGSFPLPYELSSIILGVFLYLQFSVGHDACHRAISTNVRINELVGNIAIMFLAPFANLPVIRRIHMQHHVYANGKLDPDHWVHHGSILTVPLRWSTLELYYVYYYLRYQQPRPKREIMTVVASLAVVITIVTSLVLAGFAEEVFWLWFVPTRIGVFLVSMVFVFLPHFPHDVAQNEDPYGASTIRQGSEWLLTPLLAYQNYHLIHHLYPTAPFYNNVKMWDIKSKEPEFMDKKPAIVPAFGLTAKR